MDLSGLEVEVKGRGQWSWSKVGVKIKVQGQSSRSSSRSKKLDLDVRGQVQINCTVLCKDDVNDRMRPDIYMYSVLFPKCTTVHVHGLIKAKIQECHFGSENLPPV